MKKFAIVGFIVALLVASLLLWLLFNYYSDARFSRQIVGPWTDGHYAKLTFVPDGSFSSSFGRPSNRVAFIGTWHLKDGVLIITTTNASGAGAGPLGHVDQAKVIHLDAERLVYKIGEQTISYNRSLSQMNRLFYTIQPQPNTALEPTASTPSVSTNR